MATTSLETALALERRRILADLHEGLGATLIGLLHHVQSGQANRWSVERQVREALRQMRCRIEEAMRATDADPERLRSRTHPGNLLELTAREVEVLSVLARGCTYAEIGTRLGVSLGTVTSHIKNIYRKLTVHSSAAAVAQAAELGLLRWSAGRLSDHAGGTHGNP